MEIVCTESSSCTDRYFQYQITGCTVFLASTVGGLGPVVWDFGDNSDPVSTNGAVSHTYATPGVYTITQDYQTLPPNSAAGTCTRQVKIGCCCNGISDFDPVFVNDCCSMLLNINTKCEQEGRCSKWEITVGNNPTVFLTDTEVKNFLITNYSTYGNSGSNPDIVVKHTTYCAGQEVITQKILRTPIEGIFLGGQPGQPGGGGGGGGCSPRSSLLSSYTVLPTGTLSPANVNAPGEQVNLYIAKNSVIQVNQSYTFQGGASNPNLYGINVYMGQNSGWDVLSGRTFEWANGVNAEGACCLWRGVYVYGTGVFRSTGNYVVSPVKRNRIADALYATRAFGNGSTARIRVQQTTFENNFISIRGTDGNFTLNSSAAFGSIFFQNRFVGNGPMRCIDDCLKATEDILPSMGLTFQASRPFAGIYVQGGAGLTNLNLFPTNEGDHNIFDGLIYGIYAKNLSMDLRDCAEFRNIQPGGYIGIVGVGLRFIDQTGAFTLNQQGLVTNGTTQINSTSFVNCYWGIVAESTAEEPSTANIDDNRMLGSGSGGAVTFIGSKGNLEGRVRHNEMLNGQKGITIDDNYVSGPAHAVRLTDNTIENSPIWDIYLDANVLDNACRYEIDLNILSVEQVGMQCVGQRNLYIHDNDLVINDLVSGTGIGVVNCQAEIECNNLSGAAANGMAIVNTAIVNDLSFNTFTNDVDLSFLVDCPAQDLIQCNTFTDAPPLRYFLAVTGTQYNTGNQWTNTDAIYLVNGPNPPSPLLSQYTVPDQIGWKPDAWFPPAWFAPDLLLSPPSCTKVCALGMLPPGGGEGNDFDTGIADGTLSGNTWDQWRRERYLLYKLAEHPALASSSVSMAAFQNAKANTPVGKLVSTGLQTRVLMDIPPSELAAMQANQQQVNTKSGQISQIDQVLDESLAQAQHDSLLAIRQNLGNQITTLVAQNQAITAQLRTARALNADSLLAALSPLVVSQVFEQNEKQVLTIYLQTIAKGIVPSTAQLAALRAIGEQCLIMGGPAAVSFAATFYESATGERLIQSDCGEAFGGTADRQGQSVAEASAKGPIVSVYPNPADDQLLVEVENMPAPYAVTLTDMFGRVVSQQVEVKNNAALDTRSLAEGMYILTVANRDKWLFTTTVVVKH